MPMAKGLETVLYAAFVSILKSRPTMQNVSVYSTNPVPLHEARLYSQSWLWNDNKTSSAAGLNYSNWLHYNIMRQENGAVAKKTTDAKHLQLMQNSSEIR